MHATASNRTFLPNIDRIPNSLKKALDRSKFFIIASFLIILVEFFYSVALKKVLSPCVPHLVMVAHTVRTTTTRTWYSQSSKPNAMTPWNIIQKPRSMGYMQYVTRFYKNALQTARSSHLPNNHQLHAYPPLKIHEPILSLLSKAISEKIRIIKGHQTIIFPIPLPNLTSASLLSCP